MLKINILVENRTQRKNIIAEHGLSILVENNGFKVLFDVGQSNVFSLNAKTDRIDLSEIDALVISHGHFDHAGGVPEFCRLNKKAPIYVHPDAFCKRYIGRHGRPASGCIGVPWSCEDSIRNRMIFVREPTKIHSNIILSGEVLKDPAKKKVSTGLIKKKAEGNYEKDPVLDEQFMLVQGKKGIYLFSSCSHPGIINCLSYAKKLASESQIYGVIGGLHLERYNDEQLRNLATDFKSAGVKKIIPLHCTKIKASYLFKDYLGSNCILLNSGDEQILEN
ncbi:MAG: MBL fold metallo-hydrolase [Desulfitobacteriaceae bacterium]|nr:MBL fold metallo-hydrolase [Desulfitobacteriaceae bacterium]MDD4346443.1 MBL fold metallo-hydrolase [Desulfitobacteriaceae bacterium]MDD4401793.1 MBL fold metallo-hydrolase [Desulfitobacteriaceae bacterium]